MKYLMDYFNYQKKTRQKQFRDFPIQIIIGTKNRGKSFYLYDEILKTIKDGGQIGYIRNSDLEIKNMCQQLGSFLQQNLPEMDLKISQRDIVDKVTKKIIVVFFHAKNYKQISGAIMNNVKLVVHDEFNDMENKFNLDYMVNILTSLNTLFRKKKVKLIVCGNNQTANNPYFNMFQFEPKLASSKEPLVQTVLDDYIAILEYTDFAFTGEVSDSKFINMVKKYNPQVYNQFFGKADYQDKTSWVINDKRRITSISKPLYAFLFKEVYIYVSEAEIDGIKRLYAYREYTNQHDPSLCRLYAGTDNDYLLDPSAIKFDITRQASMYRNLSTQLKQRNLRCSDFIVQTNLLIHIANVQDWLNIEAFEQMEKMKM